MLNYENQLNLGNIYSECSEMFKEQRPEFLELLNKYIDINTYIPFSFKKLFTLILVDLEVVPFMVIYQLLFYKRFLTFLLILFLYLFLIFLLKFVRFVALTKFLMPLNGLALNKILLIIYKKCLLLLLILLNLSVRR